MARRLYAIVAETLVMEEMSDGKLIPTVAYLFHCLEVPHEQNY